MDSKLNINNPVLHNKMCSLLAQHAILTCFVIGDMMNYVNWRNFHIRCVYKVLFRKCSCQSIQEHSCRLSYVYGKYQCFNFHTILSMLNNISVYTFLVVTRDVCLKLGLLEAGPATQPECMVMSRYNRMWSLCWKWYTYKLPFPFRQSTP